jgi:pantothenate kinase type III
MNKANPTLTESKSQKSNKCNVLILGSTNRRFGRFENNKLISVKKSRFSESDLVEIAEDLIKDNSGKTLCVSVCQKSKAELQDLFKAVPNFSLFDSEKANKNFHLKDFYKGIGQDRVINVLGASELEACHNIVIVDFGTCTTLTQVDFELTQEKKDSYRYQSGCILPGISSLLAGPNSLNNNLPAIPELEFIEYCLNWNPLSKAKSPNTSIMEGVIKMALGLLKDAFDLAEQQKKANSQPYKVFTSGGWAVTIQSLYKKLALPHRSIIEPNLALLGGLKYLSAL